MTDRESDEETLTHSQTLLMERACGSAGPAFTGNTHVKLSLERRDKLKTFMMRADRKGLLTEHKS